MNKTTKSITTVTMPLTRTLSMPEAREFLPSSFPLGNALDPLYEHEEYVIKKSAKKAMDDIENDRTEETVEDDYGFFPMDDDENSERSQSSRDRCPTDKFDKSPGHDVPSSRIKSSLRRGSAYGEDGIPLDFDRAEFNRVLAKPDLSHRITDVSNRKAITRKGSGLFRVTSEPVFVTPTYHTDDVQGVSDRPKSDFVEGAMKRRISFGSIHIREHAQTIGDNPSCTHGTPVQLDWEHEDMEALNLEDYEAYRSTPRNKNEMYLNHFQRITILKRNGYSTNEIKESKKEIQKFRKQREWTKFKVLNYPMLGDVEDAFESGVRKMKRNISKSRKSKNGSSRRNSKDDSNMPGTQYPKSLLLDVMNQDVSNCSAPF